MNHRRDQQMGRQHFGHHNQDHQNWDAERYRDREGQSMMGGRGQDDWRSDNQRSGWGRNGGEGERFGGGGGMRGGQGGGRFSGRDDGPDQMQSEGRVGPGLRNGRESYGYEGVGRGGGMFGGFSYAEEGMRGGSNLEGRRWPNEGLASDYSLEATNARGSALVSHRGKGPKGYKRSDDRIREDVSEALADHHDIDASDIEVLVKDGEVTLSGTVADRRTKRLAENIIEHLGGVLDVHNTLRVGAATPTSQASSTNRTTSNQTPAS